MDPYPGFYSQAAPLPAAPAGGNVAYGGFNASYSQPPPPPLAQSYGYSQPSAYRQPPPPPPQWPPPDIGHDQNAFRSVPFLVSIDVIRSLYSDTRNRQFFRSELQNLTFNSKPIITNLTLLANDHSIRMAHVVVQTLEEHLRNVGCEKRKLLHYYATMTLFRTCCIVSRVSCFGCVRALGF
jgi:hypothetical protein